MGSDWEKIRLGDVAEWSSGGTPPKSKSEFWGGSIPWISASSMNGNRYSNSEHKVTILGLKNGTRLAPKDSLLLLVRGSILHQKIQVGIAEKDVAFNQDVKALKVLSEIIEPWYLLFWFMSKKPELLCLVENTGIGAGKLDTKILQDLIVEIPPRIERNRIQAFLKALDDKIELNRQMNATLESMAQALFKSWFVDFDPVIDKALATGNPIPEPLQKRATARQELGENHKSLPKDISQLFPCRFVFTEELGWVPEGWVVKSVENALEINPKISLKKDKVAPFADMKALPTSGYEVIEVIKKPYRGGAKFLQGDVLFARITPCLENGKTGIVDFLEGPEVGFGSTEFIVLRGRENIKAAFVACLARHAPFRSHCELGMVGSSGRQRVQNSSLGDYYLSLPTDEHILNEFDRLSSTSFQRMTLNKEESISVTSLRNTLLPKLLSGELRIPEFEKLLQEAL